jgi:hypothetical protein
VSLPRRFVGDLVHFAQKVPLICIRRRMDLSQIVSAREKRAVRPSWVAIFLKAYALAASAHPLLRRCYMPFPWPRFYEHPRTRAAVAVERIYQGEKGVFVAILPELEKRSLAQIDDCLRKYKNAPVEQLSAFRRILRVSRFPLVLRRLLWWIGLNLCGRWRVRHYGTMGFSAVAGLGSGIQQILSPLTATLTYGVLSPEGSLDVRLTVDHRVLDGATVARILEDLEEILHEDILTELDGMSRLDADYSIISGRVKVFEEPIATGTEKEMTPVTFDLLAPRQRWGAGTKVPG